ncbi:MAG: ATPase [Alphaproteobacteria bacterium]|nr:ATPase [Alphaproteobacteria bacterium]
MTTETADERWERLSRDRIVRPLPKKFYMLATVTNDLSIALDGRVVKTPMKVKLALPTRALAEAVAAEWNAQVDVINPAAMPLTKLANTAIDRAGGERAYVAGQVVEFAGSDLVCYRAEAPEALQILQASAWDPVIRWAEAAMGVTFLVTQGVIHQAQVDKTMVAVEAHVAGLDAFRLTVAHNLTTLTGSALLALMIVAGKIAPDAAWQAAHVDEDFQIATWGTDEEASQRRVWRKIDFDGSLEFLNLL